MGAEGGSSRTAGSPKYVTAWRSRLEIPCSAILLLLLLLGRCAWEREVVEGAGSMADRVRSTHRGAPHRGAPHRGADERPSVQWTSCGPPQQGAVGPRASRQHGGLIEIAYLRAGSPEGSRSAFQQLGGARTEPSLQESADERITLVKLNAPLLRRARLLRWCRRGCPRSAEWAATMAHRVWLEMSFNGLNTLNN